MGNQVAGTFNLLVNNYGRIVLMPASVCAADVVTGPCKADMERTGRTMIHCAITPPPQYVVKLQLVLLQLALQCGMRLACSPLLKHDGVSTEALSDKP
jgi:hypothetical protein